MKGKKRYVFVEWPDYQRFMEHPGWSECLQVADTNGYMIPEGLYNLLNV